MEKNNALEMVAQMIQESFAGIKVRDAKSLKERDPMELARLTVMGLKASINRFNPMTATAIFIGEQIMNGEGRHTLTEREVTRKTFKMGYHLLHVLALNGIIDIKKGQKDTDKYMILLRDVSFVEELIEDLVLGLNAKETTGWEVQLVQPKPFNSFWHPQAGKMVRNGHKDLPKLINKNKTPKVFEVINKLMATPYKVNTDLLEVFENVREDSYLFTFADKELNDGQRRSKKNEQNEVMKIASDIKEQPFWQFMFYDWRGRIYPSTGYFNPSSGKLAKSLIGMSEKKPVGMSGYFFLLVHAANCFGFDKASIDGRYDFADENLNEWLGWAKNPYEKYEKVDEETKEVTLHYNWTKADDPFSFLAAIMEIQKSHAHNGGPYDYESGLLVAWDASCSGLQVLSALSRDRKSAELCNITSAEERGDYYKMIADHVWKDCANITAKELSDYNAIQVDVKMYEDAIEDAHLSKDKELITEAYAARKAWSKKNGKAIYELSKVFWGRKIMKDQRRNICKRPCMTYFYSCGEGTMADSLYDDFSSEKDFKGMNKVFCLWLSKRIYKACSSLMDKPTELMDLFVELAIADYEEGVDYTLTAPLTEFPMIQRYTMEEKECLQVWYKGNRIQPKVIFSTKEKVDFGSVKTGASPNTVHMLDAVVMSAITMRADYDVVCIHDSFSSSIGDAWKLFEDTREAFVNLFKDDLLGNLLEQKGVNNDVVYGDLDVSEAYSNEQCFS